MALTKKMIACFSALAKGHLCDVMNYEDIVGVACPYCTLDTHAQKDRNEDEHDEECPVTVARALLAANNTPMILWHVDATVVDTYSGWINPVRERRRPHYEVYSLTRPDPVEMEPILVEQYGYHESEIETHVKDIQVYPYVVFDAHWIAEHTYQPE